MTKTKEAIKERKKKIAPHPAKEKNRKERREGREDRRKKCKKKKEMNKLNEKTKEKHLGKRTFQ